MDSHLVNAIILLLIFLMFRAFFYRKPNHINSLSGKHVFITGGSSGIGFALAKKCVAEKAFVTLIARSEGNLTKAREVLIKTVGCESDRIHVKAVDVSDAAAVALAIEESFRWRPIDILICNAGQAIAGPVDGIDVKTIDLVTKTNILGSVYPIHAALPLMKVRSLENPSSIVIVSSLSGLAFTPGVNMYTPTKYAQKGLAEILRLELMPHNIRVNLVCPGFTETAMLDTSDKVASTVEIMASCFNYNRAQAQSPDAVAETTMEGVKRGDFLITTALNGFFIGVLTRGFIPAESPALAVLEVILTGPLRVWSFLWFAHTRSVLEKQMKDNIQKPKNPVGKADLHGIGDSTAG